MYTYSCAYHSWMTGTVIVKGTASTPAPEFPAASLALVLFAAIAAAQPEERLQPPPPGMAPSRSPPKEIGFFARQWPDFAGGHSQVVTVLEEARARVLGSSSPADDNQVLTVTLSGLAHSCDRSGLARLTFQELFLLGRILHRCRR